MTSTRCSPCTSVIKKVAMNVDSMNFKVVVVEVIVPKDVKSLIRLQQIIN